MTTGTCKLCGATSELTDLELCTNVEACLTRVHPPTIGLNPWAQEASSLGEMLAALDVTIERAERGEITEVVSALPMIREALQSLATNAAERAAGRG